MSLEMVFRAASIARALRVIGVIDLLGGRAVHARGGKREEYQTIGDPLELARTYVDQYGVFELYVADLDAIGGGAESAAPRAIGTVAPIWLDAGISSAGRAKGAINAGASRVIVGLETLTSFDALAGICDAVGGHRVAFSLDLRTGRPLGIGAGEDPSTVAKRAAAAGVEALIVLDLARVGMRTGLDLELLKQLREAAPTVELIAGGGVRGPEDLAKLAEAGCDGALVGTALRDGSLGYRSAMR
jgi:phosphoribosylformimino-5-aminoimidazole carboxamide ribotide isomerase